MMTRKDYRSKQGLLDGQVAVYPVIHVRSDRDAVEMAVKNAKMAEDARCHGVFLIDHGGRIDKRIVEETMRATRDLTIGVNHLDADTSLAALERQADMDADLPHPVDYLWMDRTDHTIDEGSYLWSDQAIFGGVDFKYQYTSLSLEEEMELVGPRVDVLTTSGSGTGVPPSPEKLRKMRELAPDRPLAVASGVDAENIRVMANYIDIVLAASSIESTFGVFDEAKLSELARMAQRTLAKETDI